CVEGTGFMIEAAIGQFFTENPLTGQVGFQTGPSIAEWIAAAIVKSGWENLSFEELAQALTKVLNPKLTEEDIMANEGRGLDFANEAEIHLSQRKIGLQEEQEVSARAPVLACV